MKIDVLGVKVDSLKKTEVLDKISNLLNAGKPVFIVTPYSESVVRAQKDEEFKKIINSADIALPDGIGILWAAKFLASEIKNQESRILKFLEIASSLIKTLFSIIFYPNYIRYPIPEKISGSEFIWDLAKFATENNYSIFLLGGFSDTAEKAAQKLKVKFPNLKIAGTYSGKPEDEGVGERVNVSRADFLFVAFGPARQEKWLAKNLPNLHVKLAIGLGGTFDYLAGKQRYRPKNWAIRGLEWAWRLLTQPWRAVRIFKGVLGLIYYTFNARLR